MRFVPAFLLLSVLASALPAAEPAPKPLYRDPKFDGAADPVVVWNRTEKSWLMFYTNRRANVAGLSGVAWVHGTPIGLAESRDGGVTWKPAGEANIVLPPDIGGPEQTLWAPDVITAPDGTHHMYLTVVPGIFENWQHPRRIVHLTSTNLRDWQYRSALTLASDRVIDACVFPLPRGGWRMWYNNERDRKSIYYADSPDLFTWTDQGKAAGVGERPGEGPYVFKWKGHTWMLVDLWKGLSVYHSDDLLNWKAQEGDLLNVPGQGADDGVNGGHPGVVVSGDRAFVFYFTHPGRAGTIKPEDKPATETRRSSIQVVELRYADGKLTCDRDAPAYIQLIPRRALTHMAADLPPPPPAEVWHAPGLGNPILPGYYADPSLVQHDGKAYLYATLDPWGDQTLGCWESSDFKNWIYRELNWPTKATCTSPTSSGAMVWAPSVIRGSNGSFFMYVSVGSEIWVGIAEHPLGPWRDALGGKPLVPGNYKPGYHMIDAEAFVDEDGATYLYWGSGLNWKNGRCFAVKLKPDLVTFDGEPRDVTPLGGHYFEAPFVVKRAGQYYLTYSNGKTITDTYCVYYAVGDSPFGPFREPPSGPILATDLPRDIVSPGHHAILRHDNRDYILYHRHSVPYVTGKAYRQTCVDELNFTGDGRIAPVRATHRGPAWVQRPDSLSTRAMATASSSLDATHGPAAVVDNNHATRWRAADRGAAWLQLDLGAVRSITRQELRFEYAWKRYAFAVEASVDGRDWTTLADHRAVPVGGSPILIPAAGSARYLRLVFPAGAPDTEISLFGWEVF